MSGPNDVGQVNVLLNLAKSLVPIEELVTGLAYMFGIFFVIKALLVLKEHVDGRGQSSGGGLKGAMIYFLVASMCIFFPTGFAVLMTTTFGYSNVLEYAPASSQNSLLSAMFGSSSPMGNALVLLIQVIGGIAYVRGWVTIARGSGQQPGNLAKGITLVCAGIAAMNIIGFLYVISNTLYGAG